MDEALARATLSGSSRLEVHDPSGAAWTVLVMRPDHLRSPAIRNNGWRAYPEAYRFVRRLVTRDRRWNVELLAGSSGGDLRSVVVHSTEPSKDAAKDEAIRLAMAIQAGGETPNTLP